MGSCYGAKKKEIRKCMPIRQSTVMDESQFLQWDQDLNKILVVSWQQPNRLNVKVSTHGVDLVVHTGATHTNL